MIFYSGKHHFRNDCYFIGKFLKCVQCWLYAFFSREKLNSWYGYRNIFDKSSFSMADDDEAFLKKNEDIAVEKLYV